MLCPGIDHKVRRVLRKMDARKKELFLETFLRDILFWEKETNVWAKPEPARPRKRRRAGELKPSGAGNSTKSDSSNEAGCTPSGNDVLKSKWRTAKDPKTGRTYYYHTKTRISQWDKPAEVRAAERKQKDERRKEAIQFFRDMERNILDSIAKGEPIPGIALVEIEDQGPPLEPIAPSSQHHVRTISTMDGTLFFAELGNDRKEVLAAVKPKPQSTARPTLRNEAMPKIGKKGRPPLPKQPSRTKSETFQLPTVEEKRVTPLHRSESDQSELGSLPNAPQIGQHIRRNTGGTIFLENTMTKPDIQATIKCVCGVYRAHILQGSERKLRSANGPDRSPAEINVFQDDYGSNRQVKRSQSIPKLYDVLAFYEEFYMRSKMEHDTIIMSLIYVERLVKATNGALNPTPENWRSILFACMVLASKVWDDLSMWNVDFSNVSTNAVGLLSFSLRRINELELSLLKYLNFDVRVGASEYAKYYFLIRTMLIRGGLVHENEGPLRKQEVFQKLEFLANSYQDTHPSLVGGRERRTKSMDDNFWSFLASAEGKTGPVLSDSACLEQIIG
eukprot:scaffold2551_cov113-Cylindrotheca_fusiformis.AAC.19